MEIEMFDAPDVREAPANALGQTSIALVQGTLAEFDKVAAGLADLNTRYRNVAYDVATAKGMADAKAARVAIREPRYAVARAAKAAKDPLNVLKKDIDARAAQITEALITLEAPIDAQIDAEEIRKASEKAQREAVEHARVLAITANIADIKGYALLALECRTSERVQGLIDKLEARITDYAPFEEFVDESIGVFESTVARMRAIHAAKLADETERARTKAEQAQVAAKLAAERTELNRQRVELETMRAAQLTDADRLAIQTTEMERTQLALEPEPAPEPPDLEQPLTEFVHSPDIPDPTDAQVIWTAATALTHAYGWSTAESIRRLSEMDWTPA